MNPSKCFVLLALSTLVCSEYGTNAQRAGKVEVGNPVNVNVEYPARMAVPIQFSSDGYVGPYDPFDPNGIAAAQHRRAKMSQERAAQIAKSYVPPGMGEYMKKEGTKLAVREGERFALMHPLETADLVGIAAKAKHLYSMGSNKLKKYDRTKNY